MLLQAKNLVKDYPSGDKQLRVLKGVDVEIQEGEIVAIVGPSGAGKSTLLHLLGFLEQPTDGDVVYRDRSLKSLSLSRQARFRNDSFGFVFQMYHLLPELSAVENAMVPLMIRYGIFAWPAARWGARKRVQELLESMGLGERLHHRPQQLSGGERQRVALARALAGDPDVVFCDEPTGNLDSQTSKEIQGLIKGLSEETGKTFVIVTHDEQVAAMADRCLKLVDGSFR